jgi:CubicO group peptidase (beta-lactamase class C family)
MKFTHTFVALLIAQIIFGQGTHVSSIQNSVSAAGSITNLEAEIDTIFNRAYPAHAPGATVLIAKGDKIMYRKAFGMANLEQNVPMHPNHVFQLASITKQFTSVAILMLMEQGQLSLKDPLSKYIADYPRGTEITVHHLLNHTSGIKSFNTLPDFMTKSRLDLTTEEMIGSFKNLPLDFEPNEKYQYSNSGYFLLGYIIEKVSGMPYEEFIQKHIFDKLGMKNSYYANTYKIIPHRANGYTYFGGVYENPEYLSPTLPYAAGSLMSTIDDMFLWHKAIHNNLLISASTRSLAFTNYTLSNGKHTNYGYGWAINEIGGITTLEHAGGLNGFTTSGIYFPDKNMYSIVLTNLDDGIGAETHNIKVAYALSGHPITEKVAIGVSEKELKKWVGSYQFEDVVRHISYENGALYSKREGGRPIQLEPLSASEFRFENMFATYQFSEKDGKKMVVYGDRIKKGIGVETDNKPITEKETIRLAPEMLVKYIGVYELQPSFQIEVEVQNNQLVAKATGQPSVELLATAAHRFLINEIGAQIDFNMDANGTVKSLTFIQGGNKMDGKKIK